MSRRRTLARVAGPGPRLGLLALLLIGAGVLALRADELSVTALREVVEPLGPLGPVAFALTYAVAATAMLPGSPFTIAAGLLFGPVVGVVTALAGATLGAVGGFGLGRLVGREAVVGVAGPRTAAVDRFLQQRGMVAVLLVRLVPLFPFNMVNLVSGVTALRLRDYTLATAVGIVPGTVAYAALGGTAADPTSPGFLAAVGLLVALTVTTALLARRLRRRGDLPT